MKNLMKKLWWLISGIMKFLTLNKHAIQFSIATPK